VRRNVQVVDLDFFIRSIRSKSLLMDFWLTSICLSHEDHASDGVPARPVRDDNHPTGKQAQRNQPFLPVVEAVIYK